MQAAAFQSAVPGGGGPAGTMQPVTSTRPPGSWQSDADTELRNRVTSLIFSILQAREGGIQSQRLPDFVKRLEEALYRSSRSKDEYMDESSLEKRLKEVARKFVKQPGQRGPQAGVAPGAPSGMSTTQAPAGAYNVQSTTFMGSMPLGSQGLPSSGPMGSSSFVPTPNGAQPDSMVHSQRSNSNTMISGNGASTPPLPSASGGLPPFGGGGISGSTVMGNGAPVMIKGALRDSYPASQSYVDVVPRSGMGMPGMGTSPALPHPAPGFVPTSSTGLVPTMGGHSKQSPPSGMIPNPGMVPNPSSGMVPVQGGMIPNPPSGMVPNPQAGMVPTPPSGMVPNPASGMVPTPQSGMVPNPPSGMIPNPPSGMVPNPPPLAGMVPNPSMVPNGMMPKVEQSTSSGIGPQNPGMAHSGMVPVPGSSTMYAGLGEAPPLASSRPAGPGGAPADSNQAVTKQQRWLLFLRHCAKCRQTEQECSLKQQCKFGKQLWNHILHCANGNCEFPRCTNSKELLKHHQKCQDTRCPICVPVKEYVKRTRAAQQQQAMGATSSQSTLPPGMVPNPGVLPPVPYPGTLQQPHGVMPPHGQKRMHPDAYAAPGAVFPGQLAGQPYPPAAPALAGEPAHKRLRADEPILGKNTGTSLLETFTADQIRLHQDSIRAAAAPLRSQLPSNLGPQDICKVCQLNKLLFEPPVIYCMTCGLKIKRAQVFYATPETQASEIKGSWCHACYTEMKPDRVLLEQSNYRKGDLIKKKNENEEDESWVACDSCEGWVHQICGMFNKGRNDQDVHFLCPDCLVLGLETGVRRIIERQDRSQAMLDAKELPTSDLSRFIEYHMGEAIEAERRLRAQQKGVEPYDVPGAEGLSVRVINNIVKKCETKPKYVEAFHGSEGYPTEFPFRQRVIVLFQNIEGVDICLFVMYVQEYGANCPKPNTNCVYLSYLDSVKYFRPEGVMASGCPNPNTSLRTFVYHQLQVAYLRYVKRLGFEQMYIWACPPMAGDDYILYCHPAKQKTPRSDRLRAWYIDMLKDAKARNIVVHLSTMWDMFFEGGRDHRMDRCSSTHIPYLEGDYWPGEAENLLGLIADGGNPKAKANKDSPALSGSAAARSKGAAKGKRYGSGHDTSADQQLMQRLGEILGGNMREDFIVVHLKEVCTFCRTHLDGPCTVYKYQSQAPMKSQGRVFEGVKMDGGPSLPTGPITSLSICESCFADEQRRFMERGAAVRLPQGVTCDKLEPVRLEPPQEPRLIDTDPDVECEHFETRQSFLNLCQGNHYQFDTIRRAKHSSMMVLYHLHNPDAPAFPTTCNVCNQEIEPGAGFRCTVCNDFDICQSCNTTVGHPHPLTRHVRRVDETRIRLTEQERKERNEQLQRTMALLVHACSCNRNCGSNSCRKVRQLFQHAMQCTVKVTGGCAMCKKMWCLLNLHAKSCTQPECPVPRCRELKELRRRQASRQEDQRRKAYQKMLRNQMTAQVAV